jgi:hypothetical protein
MMQNLTPRFSYRQLALTIIAGVYLVSFFNYNQWNKGAIIGGGDPMGYYIYLPSIFIHHDIVSLKQTAQTLFSYKVYPPNSNSPCGIAECYVTPTGNSVIKYTLGAAILQAPFFAIAHGIAYIGGYTTDGFSLPYVFMNGLSILIYSLLGLFFIGKVLSRFVSDSATALTLLAIALGTNLFAQQINMGAMSHPSLFFLYAVLLYATIQVFDSKKLNYTYLIAIALGLIACIRPNEIVVAVFPFLYGVYSIKTWKERSTWIFQNRMLLFKAIALFLLPIFPQLLYWKLVSGSWLFYSYGNEGFDFLHPHILDGLFCFKNGWLSYTPIMFFALIGMVLMHNKNKKILLPLLTFLAIHIYVINCWWCWHYVNGFGNRPMVETYPLMALPFAYFAEWTIRKWYTTVLFSAACIFFIALNIFQTYQSTQNILLTEDANAVYVFNTLFKTKPSRNNLIEFDIAETQPEQLYNPKLILEQRFDSIPYKLEKDQYKNMTIESLEHLGISKGDWLRATAICRNDEDVNSIYEQSLLVISIEDKETNKTKVWKALKVQNKLHNETNAIWTFAKHHTDTITFCTKIPNDVRKDDTFKFFFWNVQGPPILIQSVWLEKVEVDKSKE